MEVIYDHIYNYFGKFDLTKKVDFGGLGMYY